MNFKYVTVDLLQWYSIKGTKKFGWVELFGHVHNLTLQESTLVLYGRIDGWFREKVMP